MNQIFGYQIAPVKTHVSDIVFEGTQPVPIPADSDGGERQVKMFASPRTYLQSCFSEKYKAYCYVWGIPAHPELAPADIPEWCIGVIVEKRYDRFKELLGTFVIIIDQPGQKSITFVTDILGIRPMFVGEKGGRIVFGSDVWNIQTSGMSDGNIDYDAVSAWVMYGFNCTDGSLFADLQRLPPGSVVMYQDGQCTQTVYAEFQSDSQAPDAEQVSEEIHEIVSHAVKALFVDHQRVNIALSGGWDSRYILALLLSHGKKDIDCATVGYTEAEKMIAHEVAETLRVPLRHYPVKGSIWDIYDEVYHFMADGFPISKNVSYPIARDYAGIPMVNGFMGDALIRGDSDRYMGQYETEWEDDPVDLLQRKHTRADFRLFRMDIAERIKTRARIWMEKAVREGSKINKILGWQDFYYTHRFYISNNFLQHLELTEALLPFYNWQLLSYKMRHAYSVFNRDTYRRIFQSQFPQLLKIPNAHELASNNHKPFRIARHTKQWAKELLPVIYSEKWLPLLSKKVCIPLNVAGIAGLCRSEYAIFLFERLYLLEKKLRDAGLEFDWDCI